MKTALGPLLIVLTACGAVPSPDDGVDPGPSAPSCTNQLLDGDERDTDCGGSCPACPDHFSVPLQAFLVADDDGARPCPITPAEIRAWVDQANAIFTGARVSFDFDPAGDCCEEVRSTLLNDLTGVEHPRWAEQRREANALAARHPGRLAVLFRHGPGGSATGGGFSWFDYDFVAAPGRVTWVCDHQNVGLLAHEIGHYLGLPHTFSRVFGTELEAEQFYLQNGQDPAIFDGDGLSDTAPDPEVADPAIQCQVDVDALTLGGRRFPLPRENIMSYYEVRTGLSPMQIDRARFFLRTRLRHGMAAPTNRAALAPLEAEALISDEREVNTAPQDMRGFGDGWSGGGQLFCDFRDRGQLTLTFPVAADGDYRVDLYATAAPDFGRFEVSLDGRPAGVYDAWAPAVLPSGRITVATRHLAAGPHSLRFVQSGRAVAATGINLGIDCIDLVPPPAGG